MIHLNARSWYSFGAGASSPDALAHIAAQRGQSALALTDWNTLAGAARHALTCEKQGIRAIFGAQISVRFTAGTALLTLLCADREGYGNLCDLLTLAHQNASDAGDRAAPFLEFDDLRAGNSGLFCLSGGREGPLEPLLGCEKWGAARELASELQAIWGDRFFLELVHHEREGDAARLRWLEELGQNLGVLRVATNAVKHARARDYALFDAQTCRRLGLTVAQWHRDRPRNASAFLCDEARLLRLGLSSQSLANSDALARECHVALLPGEVAPPHALLPDGVGASEFLRALCRDGLITRKMATSRRTKAQLKKEIAVIEKLGLEEFFLTVREVVAFARSRGIRCCGRGSAANSLVAFLLGITEVDPLRHNLLFERFLHVARRGMPDIDVDFETHRRSEVIAWMSERWGGCHTAMTANVNTYRLQSAIRDFGKVLGFPLPLLDGATKFLPPASVRRAREFRVELAPILGEGVALDVLLSLCESLHDGQESSPRHLSLHSGGMVLSREPLRYLSPIQTSANGVRQLQFNKDDVERLGLIKFDVLGLRMLSVVSEAVHLLQKVGETIPDVDDLPPGDAQTYELIQSGQTLGCFQIESPGQWNLLARSQPENFDDLVAQVALFRPGPLQGGMVHPYVARRRGWVETNYFHPCLEDALRDTYGIILFQEQVLEVAHVFAGLPLEEADEFRRLMSKFRDGAEMEKMREKFVSGAIATHQNTPHQVSPALAHQVFNLVCKFVGYGFCRSHAAAFARTVYQSAFLKAHHPAAYMAAVLEHKPGFFPLHTLLEETRLHGVKVLPPCVLRSGSSYSLERCGEELAIRIPLTQIEGLTPQRAAPLVLERSLQAFESLDDLFARVELPRDVWDSLARSGALGVFGSRRETLWHLGRLQKTRAKGLSLFDERLCFKLPRDRILLEVEGRATQTAWDFQTQNLTSGPHPLALRRSELEKLGAFPVAALFGKKSGERVRLAGAVISRQRPPTAKGFCFLILEDETGRIPTALPPGLYEKFERVLREPGLIVEGVLEAPPEEKRGGNTGVYRSVLIDKVWPLQVVPNVISAGVTGLMGENPRVQAGSNAR